MRTGPLIALALAAAVASSTMAEEPLLSGEQAFAACAGCHALKAGATQKIGPGLAGIVGARAASNSDYSYSPALGESGLTWTREVLFAWIAGSEQLVPGSWMLYDNSLRAEEVQALIDYLANDE
jgi:cytochrome c